MTLTPLPRTRPRPSPHANRRAANPAPAAPKPSNRAEYLIASSDASWLGSLALAPIWRKRSTAAAKNGCVLYPNPYLSAHPDHTRRANAIYTLVHSRSKWGQRMVGWRGRRAEIIVSVPRPRQGLTRDQDVSSRSIKPPIAHILRQYTPTRSLEQRFEPYPCVGARYLPAAPVMSTRLGALVMMPDGSGRRSKFARQGELERFDGITRGGAKSRNPSRLLRWLRMRIPPNGGILNPCHPFGFGLESGALHG